jgi:hypothetical protein
MPSEMIKFREDAPTLGMNTVDDQKRLKKGECLRLVNAFPGIPPIPRNGCSGYYKTFIDKNDNFQPPIISFGFRGDTTIYAVAWIYNTVENKYYLVSFKIDGSETFNTLGYGNVSQPVFDLISMHSIVYALSNKSFESWNGDTKALSHKVIESSNIVRDMCISQAALIDALTQTTPGGSLHNGKYIEYAFQYVRRIDGAAFESGTTPTGMILPPGISGKPKRIDTFLPGICVGIEDSANRKLITIAADNSYVTIDTSSVVADAAHAIAIAQGATHLRVSRSLEQDSDVLAQAATKFFVCDLPLGTGTTSFDDTTSNEALSGETNQLLTGYTVAPAASFGKYHLGRMFLMDDSGMVHYTEAVGGDGAYDSDLAQQYPEVWASLFKAFFYYIDCDFEDGIKSAGIESLGNDLFFFKESKIFALFGGDPSSATVSIISESIGCVFPYTIKKIEIQNKGTVIFFISNEGPAFISSGGRLEVFSDFKHKELWPDIDRTIFGQLELFYYTAKKECTAFYYKNTIWIFFRSSFGTSIVFGFYFDPKDTEVRGPLLMELSNSDIYPAMACSDNVNMKAYLFGKSTNYLVVLEFLRDYYYEDIATEEEFFGHEIVIEDQGEILEDGGEHVIK